MNMNTSEWVDEFGDYLFRYAVARVRNEALAEDLVQETFLAAIRGQERFSGRSSVKTWLTGILKHKIIDHYRKAYREPLISDLSPLDEAQDKQFNEWGHWLMNDVVPPRKWKDEQIENLDRKEFWVYFKKCADELPERIRNVFIMRELDGADSSDICEVLGISSQNYWTIMHRARSALRHCLERTWFAVN